MAVTVKDTKQQLDEILLRLHSSQSGGRNDIDPTANVLSLVHEAMQRQDDLREADNNRSDDIRKIEERCNRETSELKEKLASAESRRIDALTLAESRRVDAVMSEQKNNVALASTRAELTAAALAERVDTSAKTLAQSVTASASALQLQVQATTDSIKTEIETLRSESGKRLTLVEQNQYQSGGAAVQRVDSRQQYQWLIGVIAGIVIVVVVHFWK